MQKQSNIERGDAMGFKVILDDDYFISTDALNYFLQKNTATKKGDVREKTVGAFGRNPTGLRQLLEKYLAEKQNEVTPEPFIEWAEKLIAVTNECADRIASRMEIE